MLVIQILILSFFLLIVPFFVGGIFTIVERGHGKRLFQWISGQFVLWGGIELIAVAVIIKHEELDKAMILFWCYIAAVICFALGTLICQKVRGGKTFSYVRKRLKKGSVLCKVLWCVFGILLLLQLVQIVRSYYIVVTSERLNPFYVTSPFSMWVAFLAKNSGMQPQLVEQVVLPIVFLCMSYGVFYLLGAKLPMEKREYQPLLLVILSVLAIVGEYAYVKYRAFFGPFAERKAEIMLLGCVLVPYLLFLLVLFWRNFGKKKNT